MIKDISQARFNDSIGHKLLLTPDDDTFTTRLIESMIIITGQVDMEAEVAALEEEAAVACKAYDEVVEVRDRLNAENDQMTGWIVWT